MSTDADKVTVLMPVGPIYNQEWLQEAVDSVLAQTYPVDELLIVDDGANLPVSWPDTEVVFDWGTRTFLGIDYQGGDERRGKITYYPVVESLNKLGYWKSPANVGFSAAFNLGMALADNDLVVYLAADDTLMPTAVEEMVRCYQANNRKDAWYACTYTTSNGITCDIPVNAAMITQGLWHMVGGFPPAAFVGPDAAVLSCLIQHAPDRIIKVKEGTPLYWLRDHPDQETKVHTWRFVPEMNSIRDKLTQEFKLRAP